ncbi:MAG TPA: hypothetical protein VK797_25650 [Tepidisphaeraceae bacterium]|nr:hypothetical protein [Tepidisphaeraceae bacterium]
MASSLVCVMLTMLGTASFCDAGHPTSRPAAELFAELGSTDPGVRESARSGLMRLKRDDLPALRDAITNARPLRPSQALMLRDIVQEIYLASEPYERMPLEGFMGVIMGGSSNGEADLVPDNEPPGLSSIGVIVAERIPGFCAARKLLDGDVVLGLASPPKAFRNTDDLKNTIGLLRPGTTVRVMVLRRGQVIEVDLTLDAHPVATTIDAIDILRTRRQKKFEGYWKDNFEPLLRPVIG